MQNTLFTIKLPLVKTNNELQNIINMYPQYDPYFIASGCCKERRKQFDNLWQNYQQFADSHFLTQIKTSFHQRSWEMYLGNVLLQKSLKIKSKDEGPDFIVNEKLYIECIAPTKGDPTKHDSVPEMFVATSSAEIHAQDVPVDKMILRITQSIKYKALDQYENWKSKEWFDLKKPFIIAINTGDLSHVEDPNMPNVIKALFGFQFMQINIRTGAVNFSHREKIDKSNNKPVPVNYFINEAFSFVSGVLFSNKSVLNHPTNIGDDCIYVNNPFANNTVDKSFINFFKNWTATNEDGIANGFKD